jgi:chromosomal replication initiator protein
VSCISAHDPQLARLADAIAQRVGQQRFHVWFNNSTRLDLKQDGLEIAVPNDFISEWIVKNFKKPIQEAAHEVLGCTLALKFQVVPQLFETNAEKSEDGDSDARPAGRTIGARRRPYRMALAGPRIRIDHYRGEEPWRRRAATQAFIASPK